MITPKTCVSMVRIPSLFILAGMLALGLWLAPLLVGAARPDIAPRGPSLAVFDVNFIGDEPDADLWDGLCITAGAQCTLRAAIEQSNHDGGGTIVFVALTGVPSIQPESALPYLSAPITIDGTTAGGGLVELDGSLAGSSWGLDLEADGNVIKGLVINRFSLSGIYVESNNNLIEGNRIGTSVDGTADMGNGGYGVEVSGFAGAAVGNTIRNNLISGNGDAGIWIYGDYASGTIVEGNYVGTDVTGSVAMGNDHGGVSVNAGATSNRIGGTTAAQRNIISGNAYVEVTIDGAATTGTVIQGNYIGTDVTGNNAFPDADDGVVISNSPGNHIGGTTAAERNVVSGNYRGIHITGAAATGNVVQGNYVGTNAVGTAGLPNALTGIGAYAPSNVIGGVTAKGDGCSPPCNLVSANMYGIIVYDDDNVVQGNHVGTDVTGRFDLGNSEWGITVVGSNNTAIGGTSGGEGNIIAFNRKGVSIEVSDGINNAILGNAIWENDQLGIDLYPTGVTPNDPGDPDTGPNQYQNFPELDWVVTGPPSASTVISGTLDSTASTSFRLEFFYNDTADPSGHGEGQYYLASADVTTDSGGQATFSVTVPVTIPAASFVTATATDPTGSTSEFSAWRVAIPETMIVVGPGVGGMLIYTDTSVLSTTVEVPAGAVSETIILALQPMAAPTQRPLPGLRSGDETFELSAYLGNDVLEGLGFLKPVTVTIRYTDTDVVGIVEDGLRLYYLDGSNWRDAAGTCSPPSTYFLDTAANVMQVAICHLTEWNIQGPDMYPPWRVYLPLVMKAP